MDDLPDRLSSKATFLTNQLSVFARRRVNEAFERAGVLSYHYRVLAALEEMGPMSQADLGRLVNMDRSNVAAAVDQLAELEQVERQVDPTDRRRRIVELTAGGREALARLDRELGQAQDEYLESLSQRERSDLIALLQKLLAGQG